MTHVRPFRRAAATFAATLSLAMLPCRGSAADELPRYDLPVGSGAVVLHREQDEEGRRYAGVGHPFDDAARPSWRPTRTARGG